MKIRFIFPSILERIGLIRVPKRPTEETAESCGNVVVGRPSPPARIRAHGKAELHPVPTDYRAQRSSEDACLDSRRLEGCGKVVLGDGKCGGEGNTPGAFRQRALRQIGRDVQKQGGNETVQGVPAATAQARVRIAGPSAGIGGIGFPLFLVVAVIRGAAGGDALGWDVMWAERCHEVRRPVEAAQMKSKERDEQQRYGLLCGRILAGRFCWNRAGRRTLLRMTLPPTWQQGIHRNPPKPRRCLF